MDLNKANQYIASFAALVDEKRVVKGNGRLKKTCAPAPCYADRYCTELC